MKLFIFDVNLVFPVLVSIFLPVLLINYFAIKNWKVAAKHAGYTSLIAITAFTVLLWTNLWNITTLMSTSTYYLFIGLFAGLSNIINSKYIIKIFTDKGIIKYSIYVAIAVFLFEMLGHAYLPQYIPIMSFV